MFLVGSTIYGPETRPCPAHWAPPTQTRHPPRAKGRNYDAKEITTSWQHKSYSTLAKYQRSNWPVRLNLSAKNSPELALEYWASYWANPLWVSVVGWLAAPRDSVIHGMAHGPLWEEREGGGRGANRELDTGILFWTESASDGKSVKLSWCWYKVQLIRTTMSPASDPSNALQCTPSLKIR